MTITDEKFKELKTNYASYLPHLKTLHIDFGGPSFYFHQQALREASQNFLSDRHIEMIYATLTSWGMHRMGNTKTKMVDFDDFKSHINDVSLDLIELKSTQLAHFSTQPTELLMKVQAICFKLKVSISNSKIVGNSKALAHILPNLVPPIDRRYSIGFFSRKLNNFKDIEEEQLFYGHILERCYEFIQVIKDDPKVIIDDRFNTSLPKIFDNLIMLFLKKSKNGA
jgi:hypothetical protein